MTECYDCGHGIFTLPFWYGQTCMCLYHDHCVDNVTSCILHNLKLNEVSAQQCIVPQCRQKTARIVCAQCSLRTIGVLKKNMVVSMSVNDVIKHIFKRSIWTPSVSETLPEHIVGSGVIINRPIHPVVNTAWPVFCNDMLSSGDFIHRGDTIWLALAWIEDKLSTLTPQVILYNAIPTFIPDITPKQVASFITSIRCGHSTVFTALSGNSFRHITPLSCYNEKTVISALNMHAASGIKTADIMKEDAAIPDILQSLRSKHMIVEANGRIYPTPKQTKHMSRFQHSSMASPAS